MLNLAENGPPAFDPPDRHSRGSFKGAFRVREHPKAASWRTVKGPTQSFFSTCRAKKPRILSTRELRPFRNLARCTMFDKDIVLWNIKSGQAAGKCAIQVDLGANDGEKIRRPRQGWPRHPFISTAGRKGDGRSRDLWSPLQENAPDHRPS